MSDRATLATRYVELLLGWLEQTQATSDGDLDRAMRAAAQRELCDRIERTLALIPANARPARLATPPASYRPPTLTGIIDVVARHFGVTRDDVTGTSREQPIATARQVAMLLGRERGASFPALAVAFNRAHTTVMHDCRVAAGMAIDDVREAVDREFPSDPAGNLPAGHHNRRSEQ